MRVNSPVLDQEFPFPHGETLVSTTDLKGRITYCNPAFIQVSGYAKEELLGQPHNMIRHPDMPEEAFRDMWDTIQQGKPWSALVKNRRKDGSYYWVQANVTPLLEGNAPVGYMSVRTEPSREAVAATEQLYGLMRQEHQQGRLVHRLRKGRVFRDDLGGRVRAKLKIGLNGRLLAICAGTTALGFLGGQWAQAAAAWSSAGIVAVLALLAWGAARLIHGLAVQPIQGLLDYANRMAAGDLTQSLANKHRGLIGDLTASLNQLNVNLRSIVRDARNQVEEMSTSTRTLLDDNLDLASRTESQAASLEQTAASVEQITSTVRQATDTASEAARLAEQTTEVAQRSGRAVQDVSETMSGIEQSSRRISEIIQVIDGIAFQTNILALNAAVEAARAGEQGRGFAVVAAEVRTLSQRTASAAREVKQLITDSAEKVQAGSNLTLVAARTMEEALAAVDRVTQLVGNISQSSREQLKGISQINEAVSHLDGLTQQNASAVHQIASASQNVTARVMSVAESVHIFRLDAGEQRTAPDAVALRKAMKAH